MKRSFREKVSKKLLRVLTAAAAVLLVCSVALAALPDVFFTVTTEDNVNLRQSASVKSGSLAKLKKGTVVEVIGKKNNFYQVKVGDRTGYIQKDYVSTDKADISTPTPAPVEYAESYPYDTVTTAAVNLRAGKSTSSQRLKSIPKNATVTVNDVSGSFAEVTFQGVTGYAKKDYLALKKVGMPKAGVSASPVPTLSPEEEPAGYRLLGSGASGKEVKALQEALIELGYLSSNSTPDGIYGTATQNAVIAFQEKNGYLTTGQVDDIQQAFIYTGKPKNAKGEKVSIRTLSPVGNVTIRRNNRGELVAEVQSALKTLGYYKAEINRVYDTATQKAVRAFQKKNGLTADGACGPQTQKVLFSAAALPADATPTPKPTAEPTPRPTFTIPSGTVRKSSKKSEDAKLVQQRLKDLKYYTGRVDGKFGASSVAALRKFQEANGIKPDGIAGKSTYALLFNWDTLPKGTTATPMPTDTAVQTPSPTPAPSYSLLKKGSVGPEVSELQEALIGMGYLRGKTDGIYGDATVKAVKAFQKDNGLTPADGQAGQKTQELLYSGYAKSKETAAPSSSPALKPKNMTKSELKELQQRLIDLGFLTGKADGKYGIQTYNALVKFQKMNGLKADGLVGPLTQAKLNDPAAKGAGGKAVTPAVTPVPADGFPAASSVKYRMWDNSFKSLIKKYPTVTVYDFVNRISWQLNIFSLGTHADAEPCSADDTAKMVRAFGGKNTWTPKAVWVRFADGSVYIASTHDMPHEVQHNMNNNFNGHLCVHFPRTPAQVAAIGSYATSHQAEIEAGWAKTLALANA